MVEVRNLQPGDVVELRSGSPAFTVESVDYDRDFPIAVLVHWGRDDRNAEVFLVNDDVLISLLRLVEAAGTEGLNAS